MALTVNTNIASLAIQKNLNGAADAQASAMERIGSGLRINSAKDDAAGLQIASRLTMQVTGLTAAKRNANDAISIAQTAEGALQESTNIIQRMRELAISAKKDSMTDIDRQSLNEEFLQLTEELTRISESTRFGTLRLLDGSAGNMSFHVGASIGSSEQITMSLAKGFGAASLFAAPEDRAEVLGDSTTTGSRLVTKGDHVEHSIDGKGVRNLVALTVTPQMGDDVEVAKSVLDAAKAALAANSTDPLLVTGVADAETKLAAARKVLKDAQDVDAPNIALNRQAVRDNLSATILALDSSLEAINSARGELGAKQNRLVSSIRNMDNIIQNASASRGRIQDVDYAAETAELTKQQVLQQASTAILAQANQLPASILKLLQ
jgi:flagellin